MELTPAEPCSGRRPSFAASEGRAKAGLASSSEPCCLHSARCPDQSSTGGRPFVKDGTIGNGRTRPRPTALRPWQECECTPGDLLSSEGDNLDGQPTQIAVGPEHHSPPFRSDAQKNRE